MTPERRVNKSSVEKQKFRGTKFRAEESLFVPTDQGRLSDGTASFTLLLKFAKRFSSSQTIVSCTEQSTLL